MKPCFELKIQFDPGSSTAPHLVKAEVLARLKQLGFDQIVESAGDLSQFDSEEIEDAVFSGDRADSLPTLVYQEEKGKLESLVQILTDEFSTSVGCQIRPLSWEATYQPWLEVAKDGFETAAFKVISFTDGAKAPKTDKHLIQLYDGKAFGQGDHATTLAMLASIEWFCRNNTVFGSVLDVGTGNGILLIAARKMGFQNGAGTDIDESILSEAKRNFALNQCADIKLLNQETVPVGPFNMIFINVLFPLLHHLLPTCFEQLQRGGTCILGGFPVDEIEPIRRLVHEHGFEIIHQETVRGWPSLVVSKSTCGSMN